MFLVDDSAPAAADLDRSLADAISGARVLIVDDNLANVELLREILSHHGYH